jgi:hypothetical protein
MTDFTGGRNIAMKVPPHQWERIARRDEIEPLGEDFDGFWISNAEGRLRLD